MSFPLIREYSDSLYSLLLEFDPALPYPVIVTTPWIVRVLAGPRRSTGPIRSLVMEVPLK